MSYSNDWRKPPWPSASERNDRYSRSLRPDRSWRDSRSPWRRSTYTRRSHSDLYSERSYHSRDSRRRDGKYGDSRYGNDKYGDSSYRHYPRNTNSSTSTKRSDGQNRSGDVTVKVEPPSPPADNPPKKRKSIAANYSSKPWNKEDAEKALKTELEIYKKKLKTLIIKFPDPDITWETIKSYHSAIEKVHFLVPSGPRYCFIQLAENSDADKVISDLREIEFFNLGKIKVEKKSEKPGAVPDAQCIDPYTLYVGNLPRYITPSMIKETFTTAAKIDVGFAQKMKNTRYAFIRYQTVEESIEAFKSCHNLTFESRNLIVRFRRQMVRTAAAVDSETKIARREKKRLIQNSRNMETMKRLIEKKIKKEKLDPVDPSYEPTLNDIMRKDENRMDDEQEESEEEEKEVDDDDDEDDDDIFENFSEWKNENGIMGEEEEDDEEEDEEDEDDEDEDEDDDEEGDGKEKGKDNEQVTKGRLPNAS